jgi:hypothetical protein
LPTNPLLTLVASRAFHAVPSLSSARKYAVKNEVAPGAAVWVEADVGKGSLSFRGAPLGANYGAQLRT